MKETIQGIVLIVLTWIAYSVSIMIFLTSMTNSDTYLIGVAIFILILAGRIEKRLEDEVYEALHRYREHKFKKMEQNLAESESTLRLIGKITKDKTVKDILSD